MIDHWVDVRLSAVAHNTRAVRRFLGRGTDFWAVVKADAYGHGALAISRTALQSGADGLAVTYASEAEALKSVQGARLLVMGPVAAAERSSAVRAGWEVMVDSLEALRSFARGATPRRPALVHLKADLGLRRWGAPLDQLPVLLAQAKKAKNTRVAGIFGHLGYMKNHNAGAVSDRALAFLKVARALKANDPDLKIHLADSAAILDFPQFKEDGARIGNLLYGIQVSSGRLSLQNPWSAWVRLASVRKISKDDTVGYGDLYRASCAMTVAALPVGYAQGFAVGLLGGGAPAVSLYVKHGDVVCPVIGRVGMSHALVDVSQVPRPRVGDPVSVPLRRTAAALWPKVYS